MASPLDSQYANNVARLLYQNTRGRQQLSEQGTQDSADFQTALKRMAEQKVKTLHDTNHQSNREGLFYSGQLGKRRGDVEHSYAEQQSDQQQAFDRRAAARAAALSDLGTITADGSSPLGYAGTGTAAFDLGDLYNDAVNRQVQRDQSLVVPDPFGLSAPAPAAAAPSAPAGGGLPSAFGPAAGATWDPRGFFTKHLPNGKTQHIYPNGKVQTF